MATSELIDALQALAHERKIDEFYLIERLEASLAKSYQNILDLEWDARVTIDRQTGKIYVYEMVPVGEPDEETGEYTEFEERDVTPNDVSRIAAQNAKNVILQKIREEERNVIFNQYYAKEKDVVTGIVQRYIGRNISVNLGKADGILNESEMVKGEHFRPTERIKVYILEVKNGSKGPRILVSRTHPELVKRLFEAEVTEIKDGTVEIMSIAREAGSRTKMAVRSNNPNVDAVGACVGMNGARVNSIVDELRGEKIDIITWDEDPAVLIENALSPAKVVSVTVNTEEKSAEVVVPDYQLSLAIGKEGQNARLAARLTNYKIDIKSESQVGLTPTEPPVVE